MYQSTLEKLDRLRRKRTRRAGQTRIRIQRPPNHRIVGNVVDLLRDLLCNVFDHTAKESWIERKEARRSQQDDVSRAQKAENVADNFYRENAPGLHEAGTEEAWWSFHWQ